MSEEALPTAEEREGKSKGERKRYTQLNAEFQRIARRGEEAFFNAKKQRKIIEWRRLEISSRKLEPQREHFMQRWA